MLWVFTGSGALTGPGAAPMLTCMVSPAVRDVPGVVSRRFTPEVREVYLRLLRDGKGRFAAAAACGVHPETVRRHARASEDWREAVLEAEAEACEQVEDKLWEAALDGQPWAVDRWLSSRASNRWAREKVGGGVVVNVVGNVEVLVAGVSELRAELEARRAVLEAEAGPDGVYSVGPGAVPI